MKHKQTLAQVTKKIAPTVTAIGFLVFTFTVGALTVSKNRDTLLDFDGDTLWSKCILAKKNTIEAFDENIVGFDRFLSVYGTAQNLLGTSVYEDAGYTYLIKDTKDYLHYYTTPEDAAPYADKVAVLSETLAKAGIPLIYLQAPTKETEGFTEFPIGIDYANDENSDAMLAALRERGVNVLSFREEFANDGTNHDTLFYRTDHHWTTEAAFAAFAKTVPYLNEQLGWTLDTAYTDITQWQQITQEKSFLGSIGRRVGKELAGLDDYTFFEPKFDTEYEILYPYQPYAWSGTLHDTMVRDSVLYADDVSANRYASYFQYDYGELLIDNKKADNDLHVAIVKDSFALPFTAFFSTTVAHVDMIDLREFKGSLTEHLIETKPDLVLILYGNGSFSPAMYEFDKPTE